MVSVICALIITATITVKGENPPELNATFYDSFGDRVTVIFEDGFVDMTCYQHKYERCTKFVSFQLLDPNNAVLGTKICDYTIHGAAFRLNITQEFPFGKYKCQRNDVQKSNALDIEYRLCSDRRRECANNDKCKENNKFCVVTRNGVHPCSTITDPSWCNVHSPDEYSVLRVGTRTLCEAVVNNYSLAECEGSGVDPTWGCSQFHYTWKALKHLPRRLQYATFEVFPERQSFYAITHLLYSAWTDIYTVCTFKTQTGDVADQYIEYYKPSGGRYTTNFSDSLFNKGPQRFKLMCNFTQTNGPMRHRFSHYMLFLSANVTVKEYKDETQKYTNSLLCELDPPASDEFQNLYTEKFSEICK